MAKIEKTVFISYRRTDVYTALAVYQDLTSKGYDVFFDYTSIHSGDFEQIIVSNIKARAHFILILAPTTLDRCDQPGDWLRKEIELAMDEKRNIIPLFFKDFDFGSPSVREKLTGKLADINRYNGLNVHEDYFKAGMDRVSDQFLNTPLDTILLPVSTEVQKVVEKEQQAAGDALRNEQIQAEKEPVVSKILGGAKDFKRIGIGVGALLVAALAIAGISSLTQKSNQAETALLTSEQDVSKPAVGRAMILSPKDNMRLLYVRDGEFQRGSDLEGDPELQSHAVYLDSYWIDETEVTNAMYAACVADGACDRPASVYYADEAYTDHPVQDVKWKDADSYCSWADRRLPTEAEWEKAAGWDELAQKKYLFPWGDEFDGSLANFCDVNCAAFEWASMDYDDGFGATAPVGSYPLGASPYGVLDMAGNVWEWVADFYSESYYANADYSNPTGPTSGEDHVIRGGSWASGYDVLSTVYRHRDTALVNFGFRCAMSAD